ncbi:MULTISPECIES: pyrroline-5-carboxylate reductase [unclassified Herbaspirillum]|uniref:pyrroline-5-carboxylate reductase n=1 Tax=unclassified Herbaspirillum TaxID=2624150 RepID=UPI0011522D89|nr:MULTISPECIES: pyrroline-5-carboxylate reductase [unclassified Herbaspirillum]TQK12736.1 pyrroline-5-carboxylate reductase [Herbaspirillum sp. SJZ130]TQK14740.1 pyrroline-5-carboxylate reductase [Herbaspirillum sp. SJZ106]
MKIAFIGGGNMATALIGGLVGKVAEPQNIHVVDLNADSLQALQGKFGVTTATAIDGAVASCDVVVLAVKPQQIHDVVATLKPFIGAQLVLSIAAGIRIADMSRWLDGHQAIVRAMPNTPALIGGGITGVAARQEVSTLQRAQADSILKAVGETLWVSSEEQLDAVTAISGSGPAYVFYFLEAMEKAAAELGLSPADGMQLAKATFEGATELARRSDEPVATLRERVTSKGGTTYAALVSMEQAGVKDSIVTALKAAAARSKELGDEFGKA